MNRSRAYRRHQKYRWRAKVAHIVKDVWRWNQEGSWEKYGERTVQGMEKNRKPCNCHMCRWDRGPSPNTLREKAKANSQLKDINNEDGTYRFRG